MSNLCPCGCNRPVKPTKTYAAKSCGPRMKERREPGFYTRIAKLSHVNRSRESQAANAKKARLAALKQALQRVKGLTKPQAYTAGYRAGYHRAYVYWKNWAMKQQAAQNRTAA